MTVCVFDIGKPDKNLGWAMRSSGVLTKEDNSLDKCILLLANALLAGPVALGFEAPMFVPLRSDVPKLTSARKGECGEGLSRPFSAGAGASVLVTGLVVVSYVLKQLRIKAPDGNATFDWQSELKGPGNLLLFEAFVTGQARAREELLDTEESQHVYDARQAMEAFEQQVKDRSSFNSAIEEEQDSLNLLGAILLRTKWTEDLSVLKARCLVVKPSQPASPAETAALKASAAAKSAGKAPMRAEPYEPLSKRLVS